jgi:3-methyladenine DNA glycosylase/8-oxoguanine DNA glycosylase
VRPPARSPFRKTDAIRVADLPLRGAGGEPVDFARTIVSHGVAELPPNRVDLAGRALETTLPVPSGARTVRLSAADGKLRVEAAAGTGGARVGDTLTATVSHMFRLDEDLSAFYALIAEGELSWGASGAGRMLRAPTVFEDVVKTICTTNTAWSGTRKMTAALVEYVGVEAPGGARTFPTAEAMAEADDAFYRDVIRAGYRGPYLRKLAADVAEGTVDLEQLNDPALPDDEVAARLLALPGVGPYAAAHVMLTSLGRYSRLVLDSWTRPTYRKLSGARRALKDATIERRFKRYGEWAGLAFWLYLTRGWVEEGLPV